MAAFMVVTISFDQHIEEHDEEKVFYPARSYRFSYPYTTRHHIDDTPENTKKIIDTMREAHQSEIDQRAKQITAIYKADTKADSIGEMHIEYSAKYED